MQSLSDIRKSPDVGRPEREFQICVAGRLVRELEPIDNELFQVEAEIEQERKRIADRRAGEEIGPPRRQGQTGPLTDLEKRAEELAEKADAIRARMEAHTITLLLRGKTNGEWRRWATAHPARDEDEDKAGAQRDHRNAAGFCNIDALITDLGGYDEGGERQPGWIAKYGDEEPTEGAWEFIADNAAAGDLTRLAAVVVGMHEQVVDLGKSRVEWRNTRRSAAPSS